MTDKCLIYVNNIYELIKLNQEHMDTWHIKTILGKILSENQACELMEHTRLSVGDQ
jgi:uncharacterized membrane protein YfbV (UPF0208 family)